MWELRKELFCTGWLISHDDYWEPNHVSPRDNPSCHRADRWPARVRRDRRNGGGSRQDHLPGSARFARGVAHLRRHARKLWTPPVATHRWSQACARISSSHAAALTHAPAKFFYARLLRRASFAMF